METIFEESPTKESFFSKQGKIKFEKHSLQKTPPVLLLYINFKR